MYSNRNGVYCPPMPSSGRQGRGGGQDKYGPPTRTEYRLVVENLSSCVSWQDLKDYMRQAGNVTYVEAHKPRRNEGFVEFACLPDMKNAIDKLDNTLLSGRRIRLIEDISGDHGRSSTIPCNSQEDENVGPKSGSSTSSLDNPDDEVPQEVENDSDSEDPPTHPFPTPLLRFIRPDNYLVRFVQQYDFDMIARRIRYRYPRARG